MGAELTGGMGAELIGGMGAELIEGMGAISALNGSEGISFLFLIIINPHLLSGPVHPYQLDKSISNFRGVWWTFSLFSYFE